MSNLQTFRPAKALMLLLGVCASVFAGAVISVDQAEYDIGTILEGSTAEVTHEFKIRNTGDEKLVIEKVRPG